MDLCFVLDFTISDTSNEFENALCDCLLALQICLNIERVSCLGYSDYCCEKVFKWSGWKNSFTDLIPFIRKLVSWASRDVPEAAKTAAWELLKLIERKTMVIWYTDAPPHTEFTGSCDKHLFLEKEYLGNNFDWVNLCEMFKNSSVSVWPIIPETCPLIGETMFAYLCQETNGKYYILDSLADKKLQKPFLEFVRVGISSRLKKLYGLISKYRPNKIWQKLKQKYAMLYSLKTKKVFLMSTKTIMDLEFVFTRFLKIF